MKRLLATALAGAIVAALSVKGLTVGGFAAAGVITGGGYYALHTFWHPMISHRGCQGGRIYSKTWPRRFRNHASCGGSGRHPRAGARLLRGAGVFSAAPAQTGPGWGRVRRRSR